jgi:DNA modification methylase
MVPSPASPKQPRPEQRRDWYPYYAGFTEEFVSGVLDAKIPEVMSVIDPWNGSGTTTVVCARRGFASAGTDVNPALVIIGRARVTPRSVSDSLLPLGQEIVEAAERHRHEVQPSDPLQVWLRPSAVEHVRALQWAIHSVLSDVPSPTMTTRALAEGLPLLACFYYSALFAMTRDLLSRFRATNPTWLRMPETSRQRIAPNWQIMTSRFLGRVEYLRARLSVAGVPDNSQKTDIRMTSATTLPFKSASFGAAVTSPPYATRIDYVKGVLPELGVLGLGSADIVKLRQRSTGSPVVKGVAEENDELRSSYGQERLRTIRDHSSKGSRTYYYPWMANYLHGLQNGLLETARVVVPGGPICVVAQDSYYKEVHIDLQRIVIEILADRNRRLMVREDFEVRHHRARMNPRARQYVSERRSHESLLMFR